MRTFLVALAPLVLVVGCRTEAPGGAKPSPVEGTDVAVAAGAASGAPRTVFGAATGKPVLNDWFALGSGCRAKHDEPGDVTLESEGQDARNPNMYHARFKLPSYALDSAALKDPAPVKFARECALRLNVNPPPGMRVKSASAHTRVRASKSEGTKLTVLGELKIGAATLGRQMHDFDRGEAFTDREDVQELAPGAKADEAMPALKCGEAKILAYNYTWLADRAAVTDTAKVYVGSDRSLVLDVELEPCTPSS